MWKKKRKNSLFDVGMPIPKKKVWAEHFAVVCTFSAMAEHVEGKRHNLGHLIHMIQTIGQNEISLGILRFLFFLFFRSIKACSTFARTHSIKALLSI